MRDPSLTTDQPELLAALRELARPLARLGLARGLTAAALGTMLRVVIAEEAQRPQGALPAAKWTDRCGPVGESADGQPAGGETERPGEADAPPRSTPRSVASDMLVHWLADPGYQRQGRARALPRTGEAPSFEALARSVTGDVHPHVLLDELCRLDLVTHNADIDAVALRHDAFVPRADQAHMMSLLADNVGDHLQAAVDNVLGNGDAHFEQAVFADELSAQSIRTLRPVIAGLWTELLARIAPELEQRLAADRAQERVQDQRVRIGFYSFTAAMATGDADDTHDIRVVGDPDSSDRRDL